MVAIIAIGLASPAHAGMIRRGSLMRAPVYSVPRTRGDDPATDPSLNWGAVRPPHTRG